MNPLLEQATLMLPELGEWYRTLHRKPELSFNEINTTALIKSNMHLPGFQEIETNLNTGAVYLLRGTHPGATVGIRADIDAIAETEDVSHSVCSQVPGVMHACGHDAHTACALGAARLLHTRQNELHGNIVFVFQPAEEITRGAKAMLQSGFLAQLPAPVCHWVALHCSNLPTGQVACQPGAIMAGKTNFSITLTGKSGHAGLPHKCVDVVVAGAAIVNAVQTITSRNTNPFSPLVCAIHTIHAGQQDYFVPGELRMTGSMRALDANVMRQTRDRLELLARTTAEAYCCGCTLEFIEEVPPLVNAPELANVAQQAAGLVAGGDNVVETPPTLLSEDFALFAQKAPSLFYWLGTAKNSTSAHPLHHCSFSVDETALPIGCALLAQTALLLLENAT